jgi:hypothetical protein
MLAEIFMLRCEAAARNTQSEHAANEAGGDGSLYFPRSCSESLRQLGTGFARC